MTFYEYFINKKDKCEQRALYFLNKKDEILSKFYLNAAKGFEIKAKKLTVWQAEKKAGYWRNIQKPYLIKFPWEE